MAHYHADRRRAIPGICDGLIDGRRLAPWMIDHNIQATPLALISRRSSTPIISMMKLSRGSC